MKGSFSLRTIVLVVAVASPFAFSHAQQTAPVQQKTASKKKSAPVPKGDPLTVDFIVRQLAGKLPELRVKQFIEERKLAFTATPENLEKLRAAGASDDLLAKISEISPAPVAPPPPPPPPPPVTGALQFSCAPAECNIRIDGGPDKPTKGGKMNVDGLPFKDYTVDFRREGYMPQSKRITVAGPSQPEIAVTLEVGAETRTRWGTEMYKNCLKAIGGTAGLAEFKNMSGTGAVSSWDTSGTLSEWSIKTTISGATYTYDLSNALSGSFAIACQGETCVQKNSKFARRKLSAVEAAALNTNLVQYNRYHLLALLERISSENHALIANTEPSSAAPGDQHLIVDSRDETYDLTLDRNFLPSVVTYKSKDGLALVTITYAQYAAFEKGSKYPKHTSVSLPGEKKHGIQVHYETLATK